MHGHLRALLSGVAAACLVAAACILVITVACSSPISPKRCASGQTDCGDGKCCGAGNSCCGIYNGNEVCCPSTAPHYCRATNNCWPYFTDAQRDCGTSYVICGGTVQ